MNPLRLSMPEIIAAARLRAEPVLRLWAAGHSSNAIAKHTGIPRNSVCRMVRLARAGGDPRAASRGMPHILAAGKGITNG